MPSSLPRQGPWTDTSFCLEKSTSKIHMALPLTSFRPLFIYHPILSPFPVTLINTRLRSLCVLTHFLFSSLPLPLSDILHIICLSLVSLIRRETQSEQELCWICLPLYLWCIKQCLTSGRSFINNKRINNEWRSPWSASNKLKIPNSSILKIRTWGPQKERGLGPDSDSHFPVLASLHTCPNNSGRNRCQLLPIRWPYEGCASKVYPDKL